MPRLASAALACLALAGAFANAEPDAPEPPRPTPIAERNAAVAYQRAWLNAPSEIADRVFRQRTINDPPAPTGDELAAMLATDTGQAFIADLLYAATLDRCDFESRTEFGIMATLPHVRYANKSGELLLADADRLVQAGETRAGVDRITAAFLLAHHLAEGDSFVTSMAAGRLAVQASEHVVDLVERGALDADDRDALRSALARFDASDPFHTRLAVLFVDVAIANSVPELLAGDRETAGGFDTFKHADHLPTVTPDERDRLLAEVRPWTDDVLDAWDTLDALPRLRAIQRRVEQGDYGVLGQRGLPSLLRVHQQEGDWVAALERARAALNDQG